MKFIDKTNEAVQKKRERLIKWKKNFNEEKGRMPEDFYSEVNGNKIWALLSNYPSINYDLKVLAYDLWEEQGGICCYCGQAIPNPMSDEGNSKSSIEHFDTKSANDIVNLDDRRKAIISRVFNYNNLLLSCAGGGAETTERKRKKDGTIETNQDMAVRMNLSLDIIEEFNPAFSNGLGEIIKISDGKHCNVARGSDKKKIVNPTDEIYKHQDCWHLFEYKYPTDVRGNFGCEVFARDKTEGNIAENSYEVLKLNQRNLSYLRAQNYELFLNSYAEAVAQIGFDDNMLFKSLIQDYFEQRKQITYAFCFVDYSILQNFIDAL